MARKIRHSAVMVIIYAEWFKQNLKFDSDLKMCSKWIQFWAMRLQAGMKWELKELLLLVKVHMIWGDMAK